jgi:hypothetical protein
MSSAYADDAKTRSSAVPAPVSARVTADEGTDSPPSSGVASPEPTAGVDAEAPEPRAACIKPSVQNDADTGRAEGFRILPDLSDMAGLFYVCDVACGDRTGAVVAAGATAIEGAPAVGIVLLSAGPDRLVVHCRVPSELVEPNCTATRIIREALGGMDRYKALDGANDCVATGVVERDEEKGREPLADKDEARNAVAAYMHEEGLFGDDSEDDCDEENGNGDGGPGGYGVLGFANGAPKGYYGDEAEADGEDVQ